MATRDKKTLAKMDEAKKLPDPYVSPIAGSNSYSRDKIVLTNKLIGKYWINPNKHSTAEQISKWLSKIPKGWENVHVEPIYDVDDEGGVESRYIGLYGDRLETPAEHKERLKNIIREWKRNYESMLRSLMFFKSPLGMAQIVEILRGEDPVWSGYPESTKEFKQALMVVRAEMEIFRGKWDLK
jgi:hypothetical protein